MVNWKRNRLGDLVETQKGYAFKSGWYCDSGRPIVKVSDFTEDSVDSASLVCIPETTAAQYLKYELALGDVVVQTVGSWPTNPASVVGKCVKIPRNVTGALLNQNAVKFTPVRGLDNSFLFYLLRGNDFKTYIISTAQGAASQAAITLEAIRDYEFDFPPLPVQRRIAGILSAYDELIDNNQRRIRILESMARSLYHEWFVRFRFPGHENVAMVASPLGKIPQGWEVRRVVEFAEFVRGIEPGSKAYAKELAPNHIQFLRVGDLSKRDSGIFIQRELAEGRILEPLDIAITLDGSVGLVRLGLSGAYSTGVRKLVVGEPSRLGWSFAYHLLMSDSIQATIQAHAKGTTIKHAGTAVAALEFVSSPPVLIERFDHATAPMLKQILALQDQIQNLRRTRDLLLPRLLSGQILFKT